MALSAGDGTSRGDDLSHNNNGGGMRSQQQVGQTSKSLLTSRYDNPATDFTTIKPDSIGAF